MQLVRKIHHVAYRCKDAKETVEWYQRHLGMRFILAIAENEVPSTHAPDPYMHVFLDAGNGNVLAFFELPTQPPMGRDPNTPAWVQHLALEVASVELLRATQARLEADRLRTTVQQIERELASGDLATASIEGIVESPQGVRGDGTVVEVGHPHQLGRVGDRLEDASGSFDSGHGSHQLPRGRIEHGHFTGIAGHDRNVAVDQR